ncbi:uncharacterized protein N7469_008729 [Penicillium citrinum]|uniref:Cysteine-rich transmembrane CYSTM domain-containing protein n=2 Tax=Penicillium TaxID=5073 RepID=A0A9W9NPP9_PENCI|nr:uncharacterized protein N7469_008729 [Penicillium citrinum]KAJ5222489.1 hypothetical protein N7469_008729 [Penicillium citrinum]KAJ5580646.1 hypothetical protein N7450_006947 [Penicillium hetheringtonii]
MFDAIKNWFSPAKESAPESQWDSRTVQVQQPNSPVTMNDSVNQQPQGPEGMNVHMRGGGEGEDVCCGVCAGLCCFECCECCC